MDADQQPEPDDGAELVLVPVSSVNPDGTVNRGYVYLPADHPYAKAPPKEADAS